MKLYKFLGLLAAAMLGMAAWSCDDDKEAVPLAKSDMTAGDASYNSLTFTWGKVQGARQYSYQLVKTGTEDVIATAVTKETTATFTGLDYDTEYTLTVLAYAAVGSEYTTSEPIVLTARTNDLRTLDTPVLSWTREVNTIIVSWDAVTDASDYFYTLTDADGNVVENGEGSTYGTSVSFGDMQTGEYTISIVANPFAEGMRSSENGTLTISFDRIHQEVWSTTLNYDSALLGKSWETRIVAYDDNVYEMQAWYGVEGYNLSFTLDESTPDNIFRPDESYTYDPATGAYIVPTGLESMPTVSLITSENRCAFAGSAGAGSIRLTVSDGSSTVTDTGKWGILIEDLVGIWNMDFKGTSSYGTDYDCSDSGEVEITLGTEPNTLIVPMPALYRNLPGSAVMVVDMVNLTFTMNPVSATSPSGYVYTLAGPDSDTQVLTGRITKDSIVFDQIEIWSDGYVYLASPDAYLEYTR